MARLFLAALSMSVVGCPQPEPGPNEEAEINAAGLWTGRCDLTLADTASGSVDFLSITLDLQDDAGTISGTMDYTQYYTTDPSTSSARLSIQGARTGDDVNLSLLYTTTTSTVGVALELTLSGDTMSGSLEYVDTTAPAATWDCAFAR